MHCLAGSLGFRSSTLSFVPQKSDTYGRPAASDLTHNQSMLALRHIWKFQRAVVVFLYSQWRWEKMTYLPQKWAENKQTNPLLLPIRNAPCAWEYTVETGRTRSLTWLLETEAQRLSPPHSGSENLPLGWASGSSMHGRRALMQLVAWAVASSCSWLPSGPGC